MEVELKLTPIQKLRQKDYINDEIAFAVMSGWSDVHIAEHFGLTIREAISSVSSIRDRWRRNTIQDLQIGIDMDVARLEFIVQTMLPRLITANSARDAGTVADVCIKAIQEKGAILGYRQGMTIDIESYIRQLAESNGFSGDDAIEIATRISLTLK